MIVAFVMALRINLCLLLQRRMVLKHSHAAPVDEQSALAKLDTYARQTILPEAESQSAHLFIINPFAGKEVSLRELFSTHLSIEARIARLEELKSI